MFDALKRWLGDTGPAPAGDAPAAPASGTPVVIDVRSEREYQATALLGAVNLPLPRLERHIRQLVADPATPVVLYCASGARSGVGCMVLRQLGYANVSNAGGLYAAAAQLKLELRR